jgi:hypothetical protein
MAVLRSNELRDCVGAAIAPGGGAFLPWGPTLRAVDVRRALADLRAMIDELAMLENWPHELHVDIITRAMRGPLADLMPNITHIKQRLQEHRADAAARELLAARTWHGEGLSDRRAEPDVLAKRKA